MYYCFSVVEINDKPTVQEDPSVRESNGIDGASSSLFGLVVGSQPSTVDFFAWSKSERMRSKRL